MSLELAFDLLIGATLIWLAWRVLSIRDLFAAAVLFIVFGLLMALAWTRLRAPDIALAEAAIGAGVTGALILDAIRQLAPASSDATASSEHPRRRESSDRPRKPYRSTGRAGGGGRLGGAALRWTSALVSSGLAVALLAALHGLREPTIELAAEVARHADQVGVHNPVTAVLLGFRAYDTALEVLVLFLAALGALAARSSMRGLDVAPAEPASPVLDWLTRVLVPVAVVVAVYLLWLGTHAPGGAFQAGAVLGAAAVLLQLSGYPSLGALGLLHLRASLAAGVLVFFGAAAIAVSAGYALFEYPAAYAGVVLIVIELAIAWSIAITFALLFVSARPATAPSALAGASTGAT